MDFDGLLKIANSGELAAVCADSRRVCEGAVFVAVRGSRVDGHDFAKQAAAQGTGFIVAQREVEAGDFPAERIVYVRDSRRAYAILSQAVMGNPADDLVNLAVTGTNGKTTVAYLVRAILNHAGKRCGMIGTVVNDAGGGLVQAQMTTPDAMEIARMQRDMVAGGYEAMVIEASSHALEQRRTDGIAFTAAALTNITGDHLDYHGTVDNYVAAKARLFIGLGADSTAVFNSQSQFCNVIAEKCPAKKIYYAVNEQAQLRGRILRADTDGTEYLLCYEGREVAVKSPLAGEHNVSNHLAAAGLAIAAGLDLETIARGLESLTVVPGRLERVAGAKGFSVILDYAHTDDALANVLRTLRPLCAGRLTVVFGCGGDRDRTKRPRMAAAAERLADRIIVTSDNPRTEDADAIIEDIAAGFADADSGKVIIEADRRKAIERAICSAMADEVILIAGKGHEDYQIIGTEKRHFSDREVAMECLRSFGGQV